MKNKKTKSAKKKRKYYVVFKGTKPGIYNNWLDALEAFAGFENPYFRKFYSQEEAKRKLAAYEFWERRKEKLSKKKATLKAQPLNALPGH